MEEDISNFCFEAHKPSDIPIAIDSALQNFDSKKNKMKKYQENMLFKLDGLSAHRAKNILLSYRK